jgi:hypothetical protein
MDKLIYGEELIYKGREGGEDGEEIGGGIGVAVLTSLELLGVEEIVEDEDR